MKVYIITREAFPYGMAAAKRIVCYAKALIFENLNVKVVIYRRTEQYGKNVLNKTASGIYDDVSFIYPSKETRRSRNKVKNILNDFLDKCRTILYLSKNLDHGDIVLGYLGNNTFFYNIIISVTHFYNSFFVASLVELPFVFGNNSKKDQFRRWFVSKLQFYRYDGILPISIELENYAKKFISNKCSVLRVPILVDTDKYVQNNKVVDDLYIFHAGTLTNKKDGIAGILEAIGIVYKKYGLQISFIYAGCDISNSPDYESIKEVIEKYDLSENVKGVGHLTCKALNDYLSGAAMVILNKLPSLQNKYGFSTKLGEYLSAGKAVIITDFGEAVNWLMDGVNSFIVPTNDSTAIADAIYKLSNPDIRERLGNNARDFCVSHFDYRLWGKQMKELFEHISN